MERSQWNVRIDENEREVLAGAARVAGVSVSAFARDAAITQALDVLVGSNLAIGGHATEQDAENA